MFSIIDEEKWKAFIQTVNISKWNGIWAYCDYPEYLSYKRLDTLTTVRPELLNYVSCEQCYIASGYDGNYHDFKIIELFAFKGYLTLKEKEKLIYYISREIARTTNNDFSSHKNKIYTDDLYKLQNMDCNLMESSSDSDDSENY